MMNLESLRNYVLQTRQEIDTEKGKRDSLLNFSVAVLGAFLFGCLQNEDFVGLVTHPAMPWLFASLLSLLTSIFWVRREKLQQIANRWHVLFALSKEHPDEFPSRSLESIVAAGLNGLRYTTKDAVLSVALAGPIYVLIFASTCPPVALMIILVHAVGSVAILGRRLRNV